MKIIKVTIERGADNYGGYSENVPGIYGAGDTVNEVKQNIMEAIELLKENNSDENIPDELKGEYKLHFHLDLVSLLSYYKGIFTNAALERITGINQKQLQHYSTGLKKPRIQQRKKIENALHNLGEELLSIEL